MMEQFGIKISSRINNLSDFILGVYKRTKLSEHPVVIIPLRELDLSRNLMGTPSHSSGGNAYPTSDLVNRFASANWVT